MNEKNEWAGMQYEKEYCKENPRSEWNLSLDTKSIHQMRKVLKLSQKPKSKIFGFARTGWAAAAIICAVLFGSLVTVSATRGKIAGFFAQTNDKTNESQHIETVYTIKTLPEGYLFLSRSREDQSVTMIWQNDKNILIFEQELLYPKMEFSHKNDEILSFYHRNAELINAGLRCK